MKKAMRSRQYAKGKREGDLLGFEHGFHLGCCHAVIGQMPTDPPHFWKVKVLLVTSGLEEPPYNPLDQEVTGTLTRLVRELVVARPADDVIALSRLHRPDLVLMLQGVPRFTAEYVKALRRLGFRTAVWFSDDPYCTDLTVRIVPHCDYVFTMERQCVDLYRRLGCREVHYLPFGVNPGTFFPRAVNLSRYTDVCFIGTAFSNRLKLFDRIADYLADKKIMISGQWWDRLSNYRKLASQIRLDRWMAPEKMADYYSGAKIVINLHRPTVDHTFNQNTGHIPARSPKARTFEIAACGTLQLTDYREDLASFYTPGQEIIVYRSADELIQLIDHYLHHEEERKRISLLALRRTLQNHTYHNRLSQLLGAVFGEPSAVS